MHSCPECDQACYCDLEDHQSEAPDDCLHECDVPDDDFYDEGIPE